MDHLTHMVSSALAAARNGYGTLSTGEALAAALILNDHAVLADRGMTIAEALDRVGPDWSALIPTASKRVVAQLDDVEQTRRQVKKQEADQRFVDFAADGEPVDLEAKFVTYGDAPGYRDAYITLKLVPLGSKMDGPSTITATVRLDAVDSAKVAQSILDIHRLAWRSGHRPIDANETEPRPSWLG